MGLTITSTGMPRGQGSAVRKCQTQLCALDTVKSGRADKEREVETDLTCQASVHSAPCQEQASIHPLGPLLLTHFEDKKRDVPGLGGGVGGGDDWFL